MAYSGYILQDLDGRDHKPSGKNLEITSLGLEKTLCGKLRFWKFRFIKKSKSVCHQLYVVYHT